MGLSGSAIPAGRANRTWISSQGTGRLSPHGGGSELPRASAGAFSPGACRSQCSARGPIDGGVKYRRQDLFEREGVDALLVERRPTLFCDLFRAGDRVALVERPADLLRCGAFDERPRPVHAFRIALAEPMRVRIAEAPSAGRGGRRIQSRNWSWSGPGGGTWRIRSRCHCCSTVPLLPKRRFWHVNCRRPVTAAGQRMRLDASLPSRRRRRSGCSPSQSPGAVPGHRRAVPPPPGSPRG